VTAGVAAENAKLMLEADDLELLCIQELGGARVFVQIRIVDLKPNSGGVLVGVTVIGHGDDGSLDIPRDFDIACCRSVVNVAIPQRRGSELPTNAKRRSGLIRTSPEWTGDGPSHGGKGGWPRNRTERTKPDLAAGSVQHETTGCRTDRALCRGAQRAAPAFKSLVR